MSLVHKGSLSLININSLLVYLSTLLHLGFRLESYTAGMSNAKMLPNTHPHVMLSLPSSPTTSSHIVMSNLKTQNTHSSPSNKFPFPRPILDIIPFCTGKKTPNKRKSLPPPPCLITTQLIQNRGKKSVKKSMSLFFSFPNAGSVRACSVVIWI